MEQLQKILDYRFWIIAGLTPVLAIVGSVLGAGTMRKGFEDREKALKTKFDQVNSLADGPQANPAWKEAIDAVLREAKKEEEAAWRTLYDQQKDLFTWPTTELTTAFAAVNAGDEIPEDVRKQYRLREDYTAAFQVLESRIQAQANVTTYAADILGPYRRVWGEVDPTTQQIRDAHEDIWVLTALLDLVAAVNEGSTDQFTARIREVEQLQIRDLVKRETTANNPQSPGQATGLGGNPGLGAAQQGGGQGAPDLGTEIPATRYADTTTVYNTMMFRLVVIMRHTEVPRLWATLVNHSIPIQITEMHINGPDFINQPGRTGALQTNIPELARVEILGKLYLFKAPPEAPGTAVPGGGGQNPNQDTAAAASQPATPAGTNP